MKTAQNTDERVRNMSEILFGMRVIKLFAWEESFIKLINSCRRYKTSEVEIVLLFNYKYNTPNNLNPNT